MSETKPMSDAQLAEKTALNSSDDSITLFDIKRWIERMIGQGDELSEFLRAISDHADDDGSAVRATDANLIEAVKNIFIARETTNQKMAELLCRMYDAIAAKAKNDEVVNRTQVIDEIRQLDPEELAPDSARMLLDYYERKLKEL